MKRNKVVLTAMSLLLCISLSSCKDGREEVNQLKNIEALNGESTLANVNMSASEKELAIYSQVSNRTLLDLTTLDVVSQNDRDAIVAYMDSVDAQLCGTISKDSRVISEDYTNYILMEFEKTPYFWQRSSMHIRGMDTVSRNIIVDVTYKTIDFNKNVKPASRIVLGESDYDTKLKVRYERWKNILDLRIKSNANKNIDVGALYAEFERNYGSIDEILDSQQVSSLTDATYQTGNQQTYSGLVDNAQECSSATMTVRYILVPSYTLGINKGYQCDYVYILDYKVDNDMTENRTIYNSAESTVVADNVYNTLLRYYKCVDESNFTGLYKLVANFGDVDKYYSDYFNTTYRHCDGFTLSIFDIKNTTVECGVTLSRKVRARGSNMSLPIYTDRYYYVLELIDDTLQIKQEVLLSSVLEGEPSIGTDSVDTTGFSSTISLTNDDKRSLEQLIANFGAQQLLGDSSSDNFSDLVDMSLSFSQIEQLKENMLSVTGENKAVWLVSYLQGHQNYASIKCRELIKDTTGKVVELETVYDFIYKGDRWLIYDYQILSKVVLDTSELTVKNALCICSAGSVDSLVSQVTGGIEGSDTEKDTNTETLGEIINYNIYTPDLKTPVVTLAEDEDVDVDATITTSEDEDKDELEETDTTTVAVTTIGG